MAVGAGAAQHGHWEGCQDKDSGLSPRSPRGACTVPPPAPPTRAGLGPRNAHREVRGNTRGTGMGWGWDGDEDGDGMGMELGWDGDWDGDGDMDGMGMGIGMETWMGWGLGWDSVHHPSFQELWGHTTPRHPPQILLLPVAGESIPVLMSVPLGMGSGVGGVPSWGCWSQTGSQGGIWKIRLCSRGASSQSRALAAGGGGGGCLQLWHPLARDHRGTTRAPTWAGEGEASSAGAGHGNEGGRRAGCRAGCGAGLAVQEVPQVPLVLEPPHHPRQLLVLRQQRLDLTPQLVVAGEDREACALGAAMGRWLHGSPPAPDCAAHAVL